MPSNSKRDKKMRAVRRTVTLPDGRTAELEAGVGRVSRSDDGTWTVDALGAALRLGVANPSGVPAAVASELFPAFELLPGEQRPEAGEQLEGESVFCWITQRDAAALLRVTTRTIQNYDRAGLPSVGEYRTRRYALPHLNIWCGEYARAGARGRAPARLPFAVALARHRLRLAEEDAGVGPAR